MDLKPSVHGLTLQSDQPRCGRMMRSHDAGHMVGTPARTTCLRMRSRPARPTARTPTIARPTRNAPERPTRTKPEKLAIRTRRRFSIRSARRGSGALENREVRYVQARRATKSYHSPQPLAFLIEASSWMAAPELLFGLARLTQHARMAQPTTNVATIHQARDESSPPIQQFARRPPTAAHPQTGYQYSLAGAPSITSAMRLRVAIDVSCGSASMAKNPCAIIHGQVQEIRADGTRAQRRARHDRAWIPGH